MKTKTILGLPWANAGDATRAMTKKKAIVRIARILEFPPFTNPIGILRKQPKVIGSGIRLEDLLGRKWL
jgi:hypothetical protein